MTQEPVLIGVIGGSGVYHLDCLEGATSVKIDTPFGAPSDEVCIASVRGVRCAFLPRHGRNHTFTPTEVNYRANIFALKTLGVRYLISITAVGSLDASRRPGDLVVADQLIDKTVGRKTTFFGDGIVAHVPFGQPFCPAFRKIAVDAIRRALPETTVHDGSTLVTMEGPQFSTKAESLLNKAQGGHLIGMTTGTEAKLAREAEMAHIVISMVTDMDAWSDEPHVDVAKVVETLHSNARKAQVYPPAVIEALAAAGFPASEAHGALEHAIMTAPAALPKDRLAALQPLLSKYEKFRV